MPVNRWLYFRDKWTPICCLKTILFRSHGLLWGWSFWKYWKIYIYIFHLHVHFYQLIVRHSRCSVQTQNQISSILHFKSTNLCTKVGTKKKKQFLNWQQLCFVHVLIKLPPASYSKKIREQIKFKMTGRPAHVLWSVACSDAEQNLIFICIYIYLFFVELSVF